MREADEFRVERLIGAPVEEMAQHVTREPVA